MTSLPLLHANHEAYLYQAPPTTSSWHQPRLSFATVIKGLSHVLVATSVVLENKGSNALIKINEEAYTERLRLCDNALIGQVVLPKGETPWKVVDLKEKLSSIWSLKNWHLISLSWGY